MDFELIVMGLGLVGFSSFRAFLPAFAAALLLRFGPEVGLTAGLLESITGGQAVPSWFTSNGCILVLGLLAGLEVTSQKNGDARALLDQVNTYAKPAMSALTLMGILSSTDADFIEQTVPIAPSAAGIGHIGLEAIMLPVTVVGTWWVSLARNATWGLIAGIDEDDDLGIQGLLSWAEDIWALFGVWLLLFFPILMLVLIGIVIGFLVLLQRWSQARDEKTKIPCASPTCQTQVYACAIECPTCQTPVAAPCRLNWLGGASRNQPASIQTLPLQLAAAKRCPSCAARLDARHPLTPCPVCQKVPFPDASFVSAFDKRLAQRLPLTLVLCALLSMIPVVGLIPGVILYRVMLVSPYRRFVPRLHNFVLKSVIAVLFFILIAVQWMPGLGAVTVPVMALVSYLAYRSLFLKLATTTTTTTTAAAATATTTLTPGSSTSNDDENVINTAG